VAVAVGAHDQEAIADVERAVDEHLAERGEDGPPPLTERKFSGKFLVRTSPALHARLTVEAAEQNVSLNQWVVQKLADRPPIGLFDL
jgi:predicted HicB family RNase H-like nuclease